MNVERYSIADLRRLVSLVWRPGDVFELRGLARINGQQHTTSGYFDDPGAFVTAAADRSGKDHGVYFTINPANPALLARAPKNAVRRAGSGDTTSDRDVACRRSILIDVDPIRPAGISSTDAEHGAAIDLARTIATDLSAIGWTVPLFGDSGNGAHLIYAVDLPVDDGGLVSRVLSTLSKRYSNAALKIDEKVFNAARISKIYGTLTRKGENTPERPHRIARILEAPERLTPIDRSVLEAFAPIPMVPSRAKRLEAYTVDPKPLDIDGFITRHLPNASERSWSEGRRWILPVCPFNDQHDRGEAYVCQMHSGALAAGCQHESCAWGWTELREHFEPRESREHHGNGHNGARISHREPPPEILYEDASYAESQPKAPPRATPTKPAWKRCPELVAAIMERAGDPWVDLTLGDTALLRVRVGATVVLIGGSGSGKSSLTACLLVEHVIHRGPAIALSIELPDDEFGARIVGQRCTESWENSLRGRVSLEQMRWALDLPRLYVLDRRRATLKNLEACIKAARAEYPDEPILVAIDYAQLLESKEREARLRVSDVFAQIDDIAREMKVVMLALSQMSRANQQKARRGEVIGAESAELGAESAAIERFATVTLTIGMSALREDGSEAVELSIGKWRMGKGDKVFPMNYEGFTGRWTIAGEAQQAEQVREKRVVEKAEKEDRTIEGAMVTIADKSKVPLSRADLKRLVAGKDTRKIAAIERLIESRDLVEVSQRAKGARKGKWMVWTERAARAANPPVPLVADAINGLFAGISDGGSK